MQVSFTPTFMSECQPLLNGDPDASNHMSQLRVYHKLGKPQRNRRRPDKGRGQKRAQNFHRANAHHKPSTQDSEFETEGTMQNWWSNQGGGHVPVEWGFRA